MKNIFAVLILFVILGSGCTGKQYTEIDSKSVSLYIFPSAAKPPMMDNIKYSSTVNPGEKKVEAIKIYIDEQLSKECSNSAECDLVAPLKSDTTSYYAVVNFQDKTFAQTKKQTVASYFRDVKRIYDLRQYDVALSFYFNDSKTYPAGDGLKLGSNDYICLNKFGWQRSGCLEPFMGVAPKDPSENQSYIYFGTKDNYKIEVNLEGTVDVKETYGFSEKLEMTADGLRQK